MKAIILAAGEGSRLRPFTDDRPKCLVTVGEKSLLDRQLSVLNICGVNDISLIKGYLADSFDREKVHTGVQTFLNPRYAETNMVWTLFSARKELEGDLIVTYGDIVYSRGVLEKLLASPFDFSIIIDRDWETYWRERGENPLDDVETLRLGPDGNIEEIGQPPSRLEEIQGQYIGLMKFSAAAVSTLRKTFDAACRRGDLGGKPPEKAYMTDLLQTLIGEGEKLHPVFIHGEWVEVDTVSDLNLPVTLSRLDAIERGLI